MELDSRTEYESDLTTQPPVSSFQSTRPLDLQNRGEELNNSDRPEESGSVITPTDPLFKNMKLSKETVDALEGARSEIIAGGVLIPKSDADRAYNDACFRAARIIEKYKKGGGLFQAEEKKEGEDE